MHRAPDERQWLELTDADGATWLFDVDFLLSDYRCIYGEGCRSIEPEPDPTETIGCCSHGAHFIDGDDRRRVAAAADRLTPEQWQFHPRAAERGGPLKKKKSGEWVTRKAMGACIFLNRAGFAGGGGCALHIGALEAGERPLDWKPQVCWQVPIRLDVHTDDYGHETVMVRAWQRRDWGPGGAEFNWWCTESPEAHVGTEPFYRTAAEELAELLGPELHRQLVANLDRRGTETPVEFG
ncbi:MAG: hypothetical protein AAFN30_00975 [Actinomycetota bacterium]